ncbi:MAG: Hypothetical protein LKU_00330 [Lactobacillus kefiranofaciens]
MSFLFLLNLNLQKSLVADKNFMLALLATSGCNCWLLRMKAEQ